MRAALVVLALLSTSATARDRGCRPTRDGRTECQAEPLFSFLPLSGAGAGETCACSAVTETKGKPLTLTRAGSAYCTKEGLATTGLTNSSLVLCPSNTPRIEYDTDGVRGLRVEGARTNVVATPTDFTHANWANFIAGAGTNPTKGGADTDADPASGTTAERVTFNATGAADSSGLSQTALTAAAYSGSVYAKGNSTTDSGTFDVCLDTAAAASCYSCSYVLATWTRCLKENVTSKASGKFYVGNLSSLNGGTTRSAQTVTLWFGQAELGAYTTSPASGTRPTEAASLPVAATGTRPSLACNVSAVGIGSPYYRNIARARNGGGDSIALLDNSATEDLAVEINETQTKFAGASPWLNSRVAAYVDGSVIGVCRNGVCATATQTSFLSNTAKTVHIGGYVAGANAADAIISRVCFDPNPSRCR